jgi:hypothetical protein
VPGPARISPAATRSPSSTAPCRHFRNRDDLLAQVAAAGVDRLAGATRTAVEAHPPGAAEGLVALGTASNAVGAANPELVHLIRGAPTPLSSTRSPE